MGCGGSKSAVLPVVGGGSSGARPTVEALRNKYSWDGDASKADPDTAVPGAKFLRSGQSLKRILDANSVLVVVRMRPLNQREKTAGGAECVSIDSSSQVSIDGRQFAFDACFRSDATTEDVYARSGRMVLGKVLDGFNGCVFAYGQTGSGKTYTMQVRRCPPNTGPSRVPCLRGVDGSGVRSRAVQGTGDSPGVIPQLCDELFGRISQLAGVKEVRVRLSMCEIYNEKLNDLLTITWRSVEKGAKDPEARDLAIKEEPGVGGRGIFVDGLSEHLVTSPAEVLKLIADGQARRAVGRTDMNEHSSRSHSVVTLFIETCDDGDEERLTQASAKLHLIDLAGSERQKGTGATGERLKEGAQINLSLTALGGVISALTEKKRGHVPYRDSKLTRLLQDSLGGNSVTVMLCNASPAAVNAEETMSALRFAERAKKIENVATVNRDPKAARAAQLYEENKKLRERVAALEAHVKELEQHY
jgi:hypothetical protein